MSQTSSKVESINIARFTAFENVSLSFSPGINVLIGANSTGKSHLMKVIYALLKICETKRQSGQIPDDRDAEIKLRNIFQIEDVDQLIRSRPGSIDQREVSDVKLRYSGEEIELEISLYQEWERESTVVFIASSALFLLPLSTIFLPSQEFLSLNEGFISAYEKRELQFDETYYDLSVALNSGLLRNNKNRKVLEVIDFLNNAILGGSSSAKEVVRQEGGRFYFDLPEGFLEAHLVSEGYRKIATLLYLLRNGSITTDTVLFWDEPEANLNPKYVVKVSQTLEKLALAGVQIFIATHDYLLSHSLSLLAEYNQAQPIDIKFFALHRPDGNGGVLIEAGPTINDLRNNPILEEFAAHYERELALFQDG